MPGSTVPATADQDVDLTDPRTHAERDLMPMFQRMREQQPVSWQPLAGGQVPGFWAVTTYADTVAVCRDTRRFVSTGGNVLSTLLTGGDAAAGRMLAVSDGPRHHKLRKLLWDSFTPAALESLATRIRAASLALVQRAVAGGRCDFAPDVAAAIPLVAICDLLGVPAQDRAFILEHTSTALSSDGPGADLGAARLAKAQLLLYFARLATKRTADAADDLVTLLANGLVDGQRLTEDEVVLNCYSLILGGDQTTRLSMISGVLALIQNPQQWRALVEDRVSLASATEEVLRWTTPAMHVGRTATQEVSLGGQVIRPGDVVTAWTVSANVDPAEFDRPRDFDLARTPNRHLTFAYGPHFCLGAHLARIEISALLDALRRSVGVIELNGTPKPIYSNFLRGLSSLPVTLHPRS